MWVVGDFGVFGIWVCESESGLGCREWAVRGLGPFSGPVSGAGFGMHAER